MAHLASILFFTMVLVAVATLLDLMVRANIGPVLAALRGEWSINGEVRQAQPRSPVRVLHGRKRLTAAF